MKLFRHSITAVGVAASFIANADGQLTASPLPAAEPRTLPGLGLTLMPIPAGTFTMGSFERNDWDTPPTLVTISQPFWLGRTEVTQGQWKALMDTDVVEQARRQLAEDRLAGKQRSYREGDRAKMKTRLSWSVTRPTMPPCIG